MPEALSRGDQARSEILEAARQLFVTNGYHGTSMRGIAQAAGNRAVAGLYNHFPTKEAIFQALIEERNPYDDLFAALESAIADARTAPEFVQRALRAVLSVMPKHYDFIQLVQIDMREFEGATMRHLLEGAVFPRVLGLIQQLQALPGLKPLDEIVWLRLMASLVIGFMITDQFAADTIFAMHDREDWIDLLTGALLHGIADPNLHDEF